MTLEGWPYPECEGCEEYVVTELGNAAATFCGCFPKPCKRGRKHEG